LSFLLILSSVFFGLFWIFDYLPQKDFYHGVSGMGSYQIYRYILQEGYSKDTKIIFPTLATYGTNMLIRLFTEKIPKVICLSMKSESFPAFINALPLEKEKWIELEKKLLKESDKIYYCFTFYKQLPEGWVYKTDENYRKVFEKIHPNIDPFIVKTRSGKVLWRIYKVENSK
jgi:hypothetical protein